MGTPPPAEREAALRRLRMMMLIRRFEERCYQQYTWPGAPIGGFLHLASGQEAISVALSDVFSKGRDYFTTSFRCHGYALAMGMSPRAAMAELFGRVDGCCKGRAGSMHFFDAPNGYLGAWHVVGAQLPLGIGAAFACKYRRTGGVCFILFGDGALDQGTFSEAMNLAGLWKLPAVFLLEDNGMALGTSVERHSAEPDLVKRGAGYGMLCTGVDGNDVEAMTAALAEAAARARSGGGPGYVVAHTFRFRGFSMSDAMKYRTKEEAEKAKRRDPITVYERRLRERGWLDDATSERLWEELTAIMDDAVASARASPNPDVGTRFEGVLADRYPFSG